MDYLPWLSLLGIIFGFFVWVRGRTVETLKPPGLSEGQQSPPHAASDNPVLDLMRQGRKIEAVKLYRELHHVGLKEAVDAVEELAKNNP